MVEKRQVGCKIAEFCIYNLNTQVNLLIVNDQQNKGQFQTRQKFWQEHIFFSSDPSKSFRANSHCKPDFLLSKLARLSTNTPGS